MKRVFVEDRNRKTLMPCHPARARQLLKAKRATGSRCQPFRIRLKDREGGETQPVEARIDPGSKVSGISLVALFGDGWRVLWAANLHHRGQAVKMEMDKRRAIRRSRRNRKTRYRQPRFDNRKRAENWLPPSLKSRIENVATWTARLMCFAPVTSIAVETVRFDPHKLVNPEVEGVAYQQGELFGYELKEYLLEKWERKCAYCGTQNVPLEVEHIRAKSRGGTDRVSNLTLACHACNVAKDSQDVGEFLVSQPERLKRIFAQAQQPLKDAAAVNATRYAIGNRLKQFGLPVTFWSGGRTKFNRIQAGYAKDHWVDAACVGEQAATIPPDLHPLQIKATGHGNRQMCLMDKFGFPRTSPKQARRVKGFRTGDLVRAVVPAGKKAGTHVGRVAVRAKGSFRVGKVDGINWKYCSLVQRADGYDYLGIVTQAPLR